MQFAGGDIVTDIRFQRVIVHMRDWLFAVKGLFFEIKTVVTVQITIGTARFRHHMKSTRWNLLQHGRSLPEVILQYVKGEIIPWGNELLRAFIAKGG
ncbi:Uncharacterised protein [Shigella flexneri]|nr:Uncharacterised protein [Shigella flexneri]